MVPLPGPAAAPAASPRLLLLPATAAAASSSLSVPQAAAASPPPRKRQRLAHLSPEEKALRRKLKNRVAAQSARDRKKARMGELERQAVELEVENQKLLAENQLLREQTHALALENQELRLRLGLPPLESQVLTQEAPTLVVKVEVPEFLETEEEEEGSLSPRSATGSAKSAALRLRVPLQQGQAQQSPASRAQSDLLLGLLDSLDPEMLLAYPSLDPAGLEKLQSQQHQPREEAAAFGGEADSLPASPGAPLGPSSPQLEAVNELIHFDHEYTKPFFLEVVPQQQQQEEEEEEGPRPEDLLVRIEAAAAAAVACAASPESAPLEPPVFVKEEEAEAAAEGLFPELGISHLLSPSGRWPPDLLEAASDSGYEGSSSPFSDLAASPLDTECSWEEAFAKELFPQLISV